MSDKVSKVQGLLCTHPINGLEMTTVHPIAACPRQKLIQHILQEKKLTSQGRHSELSHNRKLKLVDMKKKAFRSIPFDIISKLPFSALNSISSSLTIVPVASMFWTASTMKPEYVSVHTFPHYQE
jgi:hypothetical protein